jgi:hypothetical protein
MMEMMGFTPEWIHVIMPCVRSVSSEGKAGLLEPFFTRTRHTTGGTPIAISIHYMCGGISVLLRRVEAEVPLRE